MTDLTPGILSFYYFAAIILTVPVSMIALRWYRSSVTRNMMAKSSAGSNNLSLFCDTSVAAADESATDYRLDSETLVRKRLVVIYGIAGAIAAGVPTALFLYSADFDPTLFRTLLIWYVYCWPIVPTLATVLVLSSRQTLSLFVLYVATGAVLIYLWSVLRLSLGAIDVAPGSNVLNFLGLLGINAVV
ncbi:MAG: hypothetical protein ACREQW_12735, partial [Candidatus Binatia bacterium]